MNATDHRTSDDQAVLDLMQQVGIHVTRTYPAITDDFLRITHVADEDDRASIASDRDSLVVHLRDRTDLLALQELTYRSSVEDFGCDWPSIFPTGFRGFTARGPYARAIPRRDLPALATLLRRELEGEFAHTATQKRRVRFLQVAEFLGIVAATAFLGVLLTNPDHTRTAGIVLSGASMVWGVALALASDVPVRRYLDRVRARS